MRSDADIARQNRFPNDTVCPDSDTVPDFKRSFEDHVNINSAVPSNVDFPTCIQSRRVQHGNALFQKSGGTALAVMSLKECQLGLGVDTDYGLRAGNLTISDIKTLVDCNFDNICQVLFGLGVVVVDLIQPPGQAVPACRDEARIDLGKGELIRAGVFLLYNFNYPATVISDNTSVTLWILKMRGQQSDLICSYAFDQSRKILGIDQGNISIDNQYYAAGRRPRQRGLYSMARTQLLTLHDPVDILFRKPVADLFRTMAEHDVDVRRAEQLYCSKNVRQQRFTPQFMKNLGSIGSHPRPLARRKDDDFERRVLRVAHARDYIIDRCRNRTGQ
jgi:hypothetical protein